MAIRQQVSRKKNRFRLWLTLGLFLLAAAGLFLLRDSPPLQEFVRLTRSAAGRFLFFSVADIPSAASVLRGTVYDRQFQELAVSYPLYSLFITPADLDARENAMEKLAPILNKSVDELQDTIKLQEPVIALADQLDSDEKEEITGLGLSGVACQPSSRRYYPAHTVGAYLVGVAQEEVGLAGAEYLFNQLLRPGALRLEDLNDFDLQGHTELGKKGIDVMLTMDLALQRRLESGLAAYLQAGNLNRGVAVVMDIRSGSLLALSAQPGFDPNYFWQHETLLEDIAFANGFTRDLLRPLLIRAAALIEQNDVGKELLPPTIAVADFGVSDEILSRHAQAMHFNDPLPWRTGYEKPDQQGRGGLTALQLASGVAGLANGGWRVVPRLLDQIYDVENGERFTLKTERDINSTQRMTEPATGIQLRRDLLATLRKGTGNALLYSNQVNASMEQTDWVEQELFFVLSPAEAPTTLMLLVGARDQLNPQKVAGNRLEKDQLEKQLALLPVLGMEAQTEPKPHPGQKNHDNLRTFLVSRRLDYRRNPVRSVETPTAMPDLQGLSLRKGLQRLGNAGLTITVRGSGTITAQKPGPGEPIERGAVCQLTLAATL